MTFSRLINRIFFLERVSKNMVINRRRAPSSQISSEKKIGGHKREEEYANLINGTVIKGTQKGDVRDKNEALHSVKSGKKWQVFLYSKTTIQKSKHLNILEQCLDAFPVDYDKYKADRELCISLREKLLKNRGKEYLKNLSNGEFIKLLDENEYINSKERLSNTTKGICERLQKQDLRENFLREALFNNYEVKYLVVKDTTYEKDDFFKVFEREDVVKILGEKLLPANSTSGNVPIDYNVSGQKTLLTYCKEKDKRKNIVEIEIRNDSKIHYRQVRFNMYSSDTLFLLTRDLTCFQKTIFGEKVFLYGNAKDLLG